MANTAPPPLTCGLKLGICCQQASRNLSHQTRAAEKYAGS